jgi:hypothetical protein
MKRADKRFSIVETEHSSSRTDGNLEREDRYQNLVLLALFQMQSTSPFKCAPTLLTERQLARINWVACLGILRGVHTR